MEKDSGEIFRELKKDLSAYVELKLELLKLNTYERTGKVIAVLSYGVILLFLAFFAILFIFLALGFFLGINELTKFVTAVGTLLGNVKTTLFPTKRQISTEIKPTIKACLTLAPD